MIVNGYAFEAASDGMDRHGGWRHSAMHDGNSERPVRDGIAPLRCSLIVARDRVKSMNNGGSRLIALWRNPELPTVRQPTIAVEP
jgi:hypothetical protein